MRTEDKGGPVKSALVKLVREDLLYLQDDWGTSIEDAALRRGSAVLRHLLVDGNLGRAWRKVRFSGEPKVEASSLRPILERHPRRKELQFASAGGGEYGGIQVRGALMTSRPMTGAELEVSTSLGTLSETFGLRSFTQATCLVINRQPITRQKLIQYVATKLGGVHHDDRRGAKDVKFKLLDEAVEIQIAGKSAVYFELLSCGQALSKSDDIRKFLLRASEY